MKELYKWTLLYNKYFPSNNRPLYEFARDLEKDGVLTLVKQKDYFKNKHLVERVLDNTYDINEILTYKMRCNADFVTHKQLIRGIIHEPQKYLTSVISIWEYNNEITRLDCGAVELKYLFKGNKLWPKKKSIESQNIDHTK